MLFGRNSMDAQKLTKISTDFGGQFITPLYFEMTVTEMFQSLPAL